MEISARSTGETIICADALANLTSKHLGLAMCVNHWGRHESRSSEKTRDSHTAENARREREGGDIYTLRFVVPDDRRGMLFFHEPSLCKWHVRNVALETGSSRVLSPNVGVTQCYSCTSDSSGYGRRRYRFTISYRPRSVYGPLWGHSSSPIPARPSAHQNGSTLVNDSALKRINSNIITKTHGSSTWNSAAKWSAWGLLIRGTALVDGGMYALMQLTRCEADRLWMRKILRC